MWCKECHYGSENAVFVRGAKCPQCGGVFAVDTAVGKNPFSTKPASSKDQGSGNKKRKKNKDTD